MAWRVLRALAALGLIAALNACSGAPAELVVYSGRTQELIEPILTRFNTETGIPIAVKYGTTAEIANLLAEEGERSPADVFISQAPGATGFLYEQGLLAPLDAERLASVPAQFRGPEGEWVGVTGRVRVLVYNQDLVSEAELPASVLELTAPEYAGRVGLAPTNASFQDFITAMRQLVGEDETRAWLDAMVAAGNPTYANNNLIVEAVSRGEIPFGLVNHYYNERFLSEDPSLPSRNYFFPDQDPGSILLETTISVLRTSDLTGEAGRLVAFLLSEEAQRYFADETFEYPLVEGIPTATGIPPLDSLDLPNVDLRTLGAGYQDTTAMIDASGLGQG